MIKRYFKTFTKINNFEMISKYKGLVWKEGKNYDNILNEFNIDKKNYFNNNKIPDFLYLTVINEYLNFELVDEAINLIINVK